MASHKIQKPNGAVADEFELSVAQALVDLESSVPELKSLYISSAKEVNYTLPANYIIHWRFNWS